MACRTRAPGSKLPGFPCAPYHWHACEAQRPQLASPCPLFSVARGQPSRRPENFPLCKRTFLEPMKTQYTCLVCVPAVSCDMTVSERVRIGTPRLEGDPFSLKDPLRAGFRVSNLETGCPDVRAACPLGCHWTSGHIFLPHHTSDLPSSSSNPPSPHLHAEPKTEGAPAAPFIKGAVS